MVMLTTDNAPDQSRVAQRDRERHGLVTWLMAATTSPSEVKPS
jgi:hypothetical protein